MSKDLSHDKRFEKHKSNNIVMFPAMRTLERMDNADEVAKKRTNNFVNEFSSNNMLNLVCICYAKQILMKQSLSIFIDIEKNVSTYPLSLTWPP